MKKTLVLAAAVIGMLFVCAACSGNRRATASNETSAVDVREGRDSENTTNRDLNNDHIEDGTERISEDARDLGDKTEDAMEKAGEKTDEAMDDVSEALDGREESTTAKRDA